MLLDILVKLRHMSFIAVLFSFLGAALAFLIGASQVWAAGVDFFVRDLVEEGRGRETSLVLLISSLDSFLVALALLYFGYGMHALTANATEVAASDVPNWLVPASLRDLKETLAHVIIVILMVLFLDVAWRNLETLSWHILSLPVATVLLAVANRIMHHVRSEPPGSSP